MPSPGRFRLLETPLTVRIAISAGAVLIYLIVFTSGVEQYGRALGAISLIPVLIAAILLGTIGATAVSVAIAAVNTIMLTVLGQSGLFEPTRIMSLSYVLFFAIAAGIVRDVIFRGRRSKELLDLAFDVAQDGLWDYRIDTGDVYFTPRWFTMLGYEPDAFEHTFENWVAIMHPDDVDRVTANVQRVISNPAGSFSYSFRLKTQSGEWMWILSRGKVVEVGRDGQAIRMVGVHSDISDLKRAETELVRLANHDTLTGLLNRQSYYDFLDQLISQARRAKVEPILAALLIDLDNFKDVNDSFGHDVGDELIRLTAERLRNHIRQTDQLFRIGGDEFSVVLTHLQSETDAALVSSNVIRAFADPFEIDGDVIYNALSIGIATFPRDGKDAGEVIRNADAALYRSKRERNTYSFYTLEMQSAASRKMEVIRQLRNAISDERFQLYYQPVVRPNGTIIGAEALLRWQDDEGKVYLPPEFIQVAEETGLIIRIGRWVLAEACSQRGAWEAQGIRNIRVSVNVAPKQLRHRSIHDDVDLALAATDVQPGDLALEVTESSFLSPDDEGATRLREFQRKGLSISLDDFGTGYSSMSYLKQLPVNILKIDRAFVIGLPDDSGDAAICRATITMAHGLGLRVIAEGVDTPEQVAFLTELGCDFFQGYHFHRPLPADRFAEIVIDQQAGLLDAE